ncbi:MULTISPECIES: AlpA family transcriptional regulator [unclassified Wenzhouxiangella]|uniref:helix-turn-helix transcriptional regulator n=1 Tax=unclassified Wenzhouxiangella TaxID=2613841 RepID=UPI000E32A252|nr:MULTISPECIES: DNA-binding protein [unclassified Wenzhouxiangella]RFF28330.1 DNA-binding protein [Wenzhouxiangella sp. 15181]RFP67744.1 DNA-binding protein [Wenzhouxiangella sp. 15190]
MNYEFELIFQLPASERRSFWELVEALMEAGCDDAIVGTGHPGRLALQFDRDADSAEAAICSAFDNVESAVPGVDLVEAVPDYVGLTEIADIIGISRQALRKQALSHPEFPRPIHFGKPSLWHLSPALDWLKRYRGDTVDPELESIAKVAMRLNIKAQQVQAERSHGVVAVGG